MKKKGKIIVTVLVLLIVIVFAIMGARSYIESNLKNLADLKIPNVDLSRAADGVYTGSCKVFPVAAEVEVAVMDHRITGIELKKHDNGQGAPAEVIPDRVVEAQSLEVDIVTGATYSSKIILKAIENALESAY